MRLPKKITVRWLRSQGACEDQVKLFRHTFGDSAELSRAAASKAVVAGLDLDWLANRLLPATAWRPYREARATAWRAYEGATATAWRAYEEAKATALPDALGLD